MPASTFARHFPTFDRLLSSLASTLNWSLLRLQRNARFVAAIAVLVTVLLRLREYVIGPQRDAVAAIERAGGSVSYEWEWRSGQPMRASRLSPWRQWIARELGPDLLGNVVAVDLHGNDEAPAGSALKQLARLPRLEYLAVLGSQFTDEDLSSLRALTHLKTLRLAGTKVRGPGLAHVAHLVDLEELMLPNSQLSDADLAHLAGLTKLKLLRLSTRGVTNAGLAHLASMRQMQHLSLRNSRITSLETIRELTQLTFLDLVGSPIDDAGLKPVAGFTKLNHLWLGSTNVTDAGLAHLAGLPDLIYLDLNRTSISDAGLGALCKLEALNHLNLYETKVSDAGLAKELGGLAANDLVVSGPGVTEANLALLRASFPGMRITGPDLKVPMAAVGARRRIPAKWLDNR